MQPRDHQSLVGHSSKFCIMKTIILVALALVAVVAAAPTEEPPKIIRSSFEQQPEGGYSSSFETENGIVIEETGEIKEVLDEEKKPHLVVVVRGSYGYINDKGQPEKITYYADETGFHPEGESIPKEPVRP